MAKKKTDGVEAATATAPAMQPPATGMAAPPVMGMPFAAPAMMPGVPMAGYGMPQPAMPAMPGPPMMAMMQMMQMMMQGGLAPSVIDPSALPFAGGPAVADGDKGLDADIIRPSLLGNRLR